MVCARGWPVTGYVNSGRAGWTELRVHGVSGTPPDRMLQHAQVAVVAGDENAAFYRRRWEARDAAVDTDTERAEAYFSPAALDRTGALLLGPDGGDEAWWPWRNLYRRSDPIGGPLFGTRPPGDACDDVDRQLVDPAFRRVDGDTVDPIACGHSNYFADPAFARSAAQIRELRVHFPSPARATGPEPGA